MIVEQGFPTGPTAWLAAVGLVELSPQPMDALDAYELVRAGGAIPRIASRWVPVGTTWQLEIDGEPPAFARIVDWFEARFGDEDAEVSEFVGRDPWWRIRGNSSPAQIGQALHEALGKVRRSKVNVAAELQLGAKALRTEAVASWVIDRQWVTLATDEPPIRRPLIRYALAYIGATVAQYWPGHMIGAHAAGHLWDGQPSEHPLGEQVAICWPPIIESTHYPAWWGSGVYERLPAPTWDERLRARFPRRWAEREILGRTEATRVLGGEPLPEPDLTRARVPLWLRSELAPAETTGDVQEVADFALAPEPGAREAGDQPLDVSGVAQHISLSLASIRSYLRDGAMPEPDGHMGQSVWWWRSTIDVWQASRPRPGRPRKE